MRCTCCDDTESLRFFCYMKGASGLRIPLHLCGTCSAIVPKYPVPINSENTEAQVSFHNNYWSTCTNEEYAALAEELRNLVDFYRAVLGPPSSEQDIFEIGAGRGGLLAALKLEGYHALGCEPSQLLVQQARKHYGLSDTDLVQMEGPDFLNRLKAGGKTAKAFFVWHVIEHVEKPVSLLRQMKDLLAPEGQIILQAPLPSPASLYPEHLYLFTQQLAFKLGEMAGLETVFVGLSKTEQFLSFSYALPNSSYRPVTYPGEDVLGVWLTSLTE